MAQTRDREKSLQQLDTLLRHSFKAIKQDVLSLDEVSHQNSLRAQELGKVLEDMKRDFVTIDKFNVLKIKVGELNENLKKMWDLDSKVADLDAKNLKEKDFDEKAQKWENEFAKIKQDITKVKDKSATLTELKTLADDINAEFKKFRESLDYVKDMKEAVSPDELERRTKAMHAHIEDIEHEFSKIEKRDLVDASQLKQVVEDVNAEFNAVKDAFVNIRKYMTGFAKKSSVDKEFAVRDEQSIRMDKDISAIKRQQKDFVTLSTTDQLVKDINAEFDTVKLSVSKSREMLLARIGVVLQSLDKTDAKLQRVENDTMSQKQAESLLGDINQEFNGIKNALLTIKSDVNAREQQLKALVSAQKADLATVKKTYATEKQAQSLADDVSKELDAMKKVAVKLNAEIAKTRSDSMSTKQARAFIAEVNGEFNTIKAALLKIRETTQADQKRVDARLAAQDKNIAALPSKFTTRQQGEDLVKDMNSEFDAVRKELAELDVQQRSRLNKETKQRTAAVSKASADLVRARNEFLAFKTQYATVKQAKQIIADVNKEFDVIREELATQDSTTKKTVETTRSQLRKAITQAEERVKKLDKEKFSVGSAKNLLADLNKEFDVLRAQIAESAPKNTATKKDVQALKIQLHKAISQSEDRLKKLDKDKLTVGAAKNLVADMNKELDLIKESHDAHASKVAKLEKNAAYLSDVQELRKELLKKISSVKPVSTENGVKKKQVENLVKDLNSEFDIVKESHAELAGSLQEFKKKTDGSLKDKATQKDLARLEKQLIGSLDVLRNDLQLSMQAFVARSELKKVSNKVQAISSDYVDVGQYESLLKEMKKLRGAGFENVAQARAHAKAAKKASSKKKTVAEPVTKTEGVPFNKTYVMGNVLMGAAFVLLAGAIVSFFMQVFTQYTDHMMWGAVGTFVVGLALKVFAILKR